MKPRNAVREGSLWVMTSCFNPVDSRCRVANYRRFRAALAAPLATIELGFNDRWDLTERDADLYVRVGDADVLWQKERLLNLLLRRLPPECEYVAWLDGDVLMMDPEWPQQTIAALATQPLVQLFSTLRYLENDESEQQAGLRVDSVAAAVHGGQSPAAVMGRVTDRSGGAPSAGMAWAARRDLLERHGFHDSCVIGGGDTALACAAWGVPGVAMQLHHMNAGQRARYGEWAGRFHGDVRAAVGVLKGEIRHLWHGDLPSRRAGARHVDLAAHGFDPAADIAPGADGAWRWASDKPLLHALLRDYFRGREQGGVSG